MGRGGKRPGAGRKPLLSDLDRLRVGAKCQRLHRKHVEDNLEKEIARNTENFRREQESLKWETGQSRVRIPADDLKDVLRLDQKLDVDQEPCPLVGVAVKRPKGVRNDILARVASETGLTTSMVNKCWKWYRAMIREEE